MESKMASSTTIMTEATAIHRAEIKEHALPKGWNSEAIDDLQEQFFQAFERGEKFQRAKDQERIEKDIEHKFSRAMTLAEMLFHKVHKDFNTQIKKLSLRYCNFPKFEALYVIPSEFFYSDKMLDVYRTSNKLKSDFYDDSFRIDFRFVAENENLSFELLEADGFNLNFKSEEVESATN